MPSDTDRKNSDTIWVWKALGASLVLTDRPTGESSSSPTVKTDMMSTTPHTGAVLAPAGMSRNSRNAPPIAAVPSANLIGVDGWRSPIFVHTAANTGASRITHTDSIDCTHDTGKSQPNRLRSMRLSL